MKIWPMEDVSNVTQMIVLICIFIYACRAAAGTKEPVIARFFALGIFTCLLGDVFWSLYILLFKEAPSGISPADIGWIGAYCFLIGFMQITSRGKHRPKWLIIMPALVACDTAVWISWAQGNVGSIMNDVTYGIAFGVMFWYTFANIVATRGPLRPFFISTACYLLMEMVLFTSWGAAYAYFDLMVTACLIAMAVTFVRGISSEEVAR